MRSTVTVLLASIDKFGKTATVAELIAAGTRLEKLGMIGTLSAAFYAGACIGSLAVATGRTLSGGATNLRAGERLWSSSSSRAAGLDYGPSGLGPCTHVEPSRRHTRARSPPTPLENPWTVSPAPV